MKVLTVDELRAHKGNRTPLFHVEYLPYAGSPLDDVRWGLREDVYTTREEAVARFGALTPSGHVETVEMHETVYDRAGGRTRQLLDKWDDTDGSPPSARHK